MRLFFSFFFLLIISLNALAPLMEQLQGKNLYELAELKVDDADDEGKKETEKEEYEKEATLPVSGGHSIRRLAFELLIPKEALFPTNPLPNSGLFTSSPDLPPEA